MRTYIIEKTKREGLAYKVIIAMIEQFQLLKRVPLFIGRRKKIEQYFKNNSIRKIHLGSGGIELKDFLNSDLFIGDIPIDVTRKLPFKDESVQLIYSSHQVEHILRREFEKFISECYRVLDSKGKLLIATPSLEKISKNLYNKSPEYQEYANANAKAMLVPSTPAGVLNGIMHLAYGHKYLYDYETISTICRANGFSSIKIIPNGHTGETEIDQYYSPQKDEYWDLRTEEYKVHKDEFWDLETETYEIIK